jgi:hypothetical protein
MMVNRRRRFSRSAIAGAAVIGASGMSGEASRSVASIAPQNFIRARRGLVAGQALRKMRAAVWSY